MYPILYLFHAFIFFSLKWKTRQLGISTSVSRLQVWPKKMRRAVGNYCLISLFSSWKQPELQSFWVLVGPISEVWNLKSVKCLERLHRCVLLFQSFCFYFRQRGIVNYRSSPKITHVYLINISDFNFIQRDKKKKSRHSNTNSVWYWRSIGDLA